MARQVEIYDLLNFMRSADASDLHLAANSPPILRVDGVLRKTELPILLPEDVHSLIYDIMNDEQRRIYEEELELDFSVEIKAMGRYRVNVFNELYGDSAVFRSISEKTYSFNELGLPSVLKDLISHDKGLILVTGPTGSGKSTTLNTLINYINENMQKHIITIEDPVEFIHGSKRSLIRHREIGSNTKSFGRALRSALREDPDVIVIGEMRDLETTALAITAAETGHLVFGTLHTVNATKTLDRVIDQFPSTQQSQIRVMLSESIVGIVSQVLMKKVGGGRVAAFEILIGTPAVANLIREAKTFQLPSILQTGSYIGMTTMEQSLVTLIKEKKINPSDAMDVVSNSTEFKKMLDK